MRKTLLPCVLVGLLTGCSSAQLSMLVDNPRLARVERSRLAKVVRDLPHVKSQQELIALLGSPAWCLHPEGCSWTLEVEHFSGLIPAAPHRPQVKVEHGDTLIVSCMPTCESSVEPGTPWPSRQWPRGGVSRR